MPTDGAMPLAAVLGVVVARYGRPIRSLRWSDLGSADGFSGARVWRGDIKDGHAFALKAWPSDVSSRHLSAVHAAMTAAGHLAFVPAVVPTVSNETVVFDGGRCWDLTTWMPGEADDSGALSPARVANACAALARLHAAWRTAGGTTGPCPAAIARLKVLGKWQEWVAASANASRCPHPELVAAVEAGQAVAAAGADAVHRRLREWAARPLSLQLCLRDVRAAHVLFTGDAVTGIVDYGGAKTDHVAADLARFLGDAAGDDRAFADGLRAYRDAGGVLDVPDDFVRVLDAAGTVCGVLNWLRRVPETDFRLVSPERVAARLRRLVGRTQRLSGC